MPALELYASEMHRIPDPPHPNTHYQVQFDATGGGAFVTVSVCTDITSVNRCAELLTQLSLYHDDTLIIVSWPDPDPEHATKLYVTRHL